ncbi:GNAT family N-acetyltransferase [Modestobacter sp. VKM Ac-2983]|uniref:GNAT family N-acetyltransferase n=1 Tax=Modestobacter sp. VKM Ac-2983 TaxID=3004137 RepID=UPI0022AB7F6D|nr:GNAT family N-acetyltransferase [Modestobacter sp. VKM Ac-2983]MCZ2806079.1 GNAT family N-acetyltransferase [Modestobacter sp. VKM Ac-2983]
MSHIRTTVTVRSAPTADLSAAELHRLRGFLDTAFTGGFSDDDWSHALGGVHVLATVDGELAGHAAVVVRQLITAGRTLRTGYVEAVATAATLRRRGVGAAVMAEAERFVRGGFELGALAASEDGARLYGPRGWLPWSGDLAALTPEGVVATPGEPVFVLPTPATPAPLDLADRLVCDWRRGDLW